MKKNVLDNVQLSIFEDVRMVSDAVLAQHVSNREELEFSADRLNSWLESLTPMRRRIARSAIELYKRSQANRANSQRVTNSRDLFDLMKPFVCDLEIEEFWAIAVNNRMAVKEVIRLSTGGIDFTVVDIRALMRVLLRTGCTSFFICHNHPSGTLQPSRQDDQLTERVREASKLLEIRLLDHVIIGVNNYYSYSDEGRI